MTLRERERAAHVESSDGAQSSTSEDFRQFDSVALFFFHLSVLSTLSITSLFLDAFRFGFQVFCCLYMLSVRLQSGSVQTRLLKHGADHLCEFRSETFGHLLWFTDARYHACYLMSERSFGPAQRRTGFNDKVVKGSGFCKTCHFF